MVTRLVNNDIDKWAHHDLLILPEQQVLYIAHEIITIDDTEQGGEAETRVLVDSLRRWDQVTHTTEELWTRATTCRWPIGCAGPATSRTG